VVVNVRKSVTISTNKSKENVVSTETYLQLMNVIRNPTSAKKDYSSDVYLKLKNRVERNKLKVIYDKELDVELDSTFVTNLRICNDNNEVLPRYEQLYDIVKIFHSQLIHPNSRTLYKAIRQHFICIPRWVVEIYHKLCPQCSQQRAKPETKAHKRPIRPIHSNGICDRFVVDLIDYRHNPGGKSLNLGIEFKYLFHARDHFSGFSFIEPMMDKSAAWATYALRKMMHVFGASGIIHTDNGSEFKAEFELVVDDWAARIAHGRPYHPQSQGKVERGNGQFKKKLHSYCEEHKISDWAACAFEVVHFGMNSVVSRTTNKSPYAMVFGQDPDTPFWTSELQPDKDIIDLSEQTNIDIKQSENETQTLPSDNNDSSNSFTDNIQLLSYNNVNNKYNNIAINNVLNNINTSKNCITDVNDNINTSVHDNNDSNIVLAYDNYLRNYDKNNTIDNNNKTNDDNHNSVIDKKDLSVKYLNVNEEGELCPGAAAQINKMGVIFKRYGCATDGNCAFYSIHDAMEPGIFRILDAKNKKQKITNERNNISDMIDKDWFDKCMRPYLSNEFTEDIFNSMWSPTKLIGSEHLSALAHIWKINLFSLVHTLKVNEDGTAATSACKVMLNGFEYVPELPSVAIYAINKVKISDGGIYGHYEALLNERGIGVHDPSSLESKILASKAGVIDTALGDPTTPHYHIRNNSKEHKQNYVNNMITAANKDRAQHMIKYAVKDVIGIRVSKYKLKYKIPVSIKIGIIVRVLDDNQYLIQTDKGLVQVDSYDLERVDKDTFKYLISNLPKPSERQIDKKLSKDEVMTIVQLAVTMRGNTLQRKHLKEAAKKSKANRKRKLTNEEKKNTNNCHLHSDTNNKRKFDVINSPLHSESDVEQSPTKLITPIKRIRFRIPNSDTNDDTNSMKIVEMEPMDSLMWSSP
jgi:hypothetical protein